MIILKIMALSVLIPAWAFGIARAIDLSARGGYDNGVGAFAVIWLLITGTAARAIIETML